MTTNETRMIALASIAHDAYFDDLDDRANRIPYMRALLDCESIDPMNLIALADCICDDIADLISNANIADMLPIDIDDDELTELETDLRHNLDFARMIAALIIANDCDSLND